MLKIIVFFDKRLRKKSQTKPPIMKRIHYYIDLIRLKRPKKAQKISMPKQVYIQKKYNSQKSTSYQKYLQHFTV